ncbi:MAG: hypothetical protein Q4C47_06835, partial [Planctomycetia bacterium]|nr:hypothetical protein [Planctomycetia bacterium]
HIRGIRGMGLLIRPWSHRDVEALAELWLNRRGEPHPLRPDGVREWLLSQVTGNTFFDREGLLLAFRTESDDGCGSRGRLVGMVHAAFPPSGEYLLPLRSDASESSGAAHAPPTAFREGILTMMITDESLPEDEQRYIIKGLLERAESYLRGRHVQTIYGGGIRPLNNPPFWNGFCGAGDAWGIPDEQKLVHEVLGEAGYQEVRHTVVWRRKNSLPPPIVGEIVAARHHCQATLCEWEPATAWEMLTMQPGAPLEFRVHTPDGTRLGRLVLRKLSTISPEGGQPTDLFVTHWMSSDPVGGRVQATRREIVLVLMDAAVELLRRQSPGGMIEWILCSDPTFAMRADVARVFGFEIVKRGTVRRGGS